MLVWNPLLKSDFNTLVNVSFQLAGLESFLSSVVEDGIERVSLSEFLQENFNRDSLLPELHISDKLVSLSVVNEAEIVSIILLDHEFGLGFFTSMSSDLDEFIVCSDSKRDI